MLQPLSRLRAAALTASRSSICKRRRLFQPKQNKTAASAAAGNNGADFLSNAAVVAAVFTVNVEYQMPAGVGTVARVKLHAAP